MTWSTAEVVRMSGVTSRTLRHYDAVGLLRPAGTDHSGQRYYGEDELLRLQQILVLRELGLGLAPIADVLDRTSDEVTALRAHLTRLRAERDRISALEQTVERTIAELESRKDNGAMTKINRPEDLFAGFHPDEDHYAREQWPEQWEQAKQFVTSLTPADEERMKRERTAEMIRMAELMVAGAAPDDPVVLEEVAVHHRAVARFWTPTAAAFASLGRSYVEDEQWRTAYNAVAAGLAEFQRDAMAAYAETRMS